jgi:hypothetical protein
LLQCLRRKIVPVGSGSLQAEKQYSFPHGAGIRRQIGGIGAGKSLRKRRTQIGVLEQKVQQHSDGSPFIIPRCHGR